MVVLGCMCLLGRVILMCWMLVGWMWSISSSPAVGRVACGALTLRYLERVVVLEV
jgi:hypothetical protein